MQRGSVAVAVATSDGLAMATDSRTTEQEGDPPVYRVATDAAEKLFVAEGRLGISTYGMATIGDRGIRGLLEDFAPPADLDVHEYAKVLGDHFHGLLSAATPPRRGYLVKVADLRWPLGFVVTGFDAGGVGHVLDVKVRPANSRVDPADQVTTVNPGVVPRGQVDAIERLVDGVDWKRINKIKVKLDGQTQDTLRLLRYDLDLPASVPDAVRFAEFLVETQIRMQAVSRGTYAVPTDVPGCGGVVRSLGVTRAGAEWFSNPGTAAVGQARETPAEQGLGARGHAPRSA